MDPDGLSRILSNNSSNVIYQKLLNQLDKFAEYEVEGKKTSLHITHGRAFLGVHPRKLGLLLNIVLDTPLPIGRFRKSEKVSANRYHNEIELNSPDDLDSEVVKWVKAAYSLTT